MGARRIAMLLMLAAGQACAQPASSDSATNGKRIFVPSPLQWDSAMLSYRPALRQTGSDFANMTGGVAFGMSPAQVNLLLPEPYPGLSWNTLAMANEYPGEARYLAVPMVSAGPLRMGLTACAGARSNVVFLFSPNGLFRLSYRLIADTACSDTNPAAQEIFARYVPISPLVALSMRYRTGKTEVVDITDSTAGYLTQIHWRQGGR
jgi:hypothetical protein